MTVFFKKSFLIISTFCMLFSFTGCENNNDIKFIDTNVNMTPRLINVSNNSNIVETIEEVRSAVVGISARSGDGYSVGSGAAVAPNGYILTNHHVVENANNVTIYFANKTQANAEIIWSDSALDLAIIKSNKSLPYLDFGQLSDIKVGQDIIAIGTPLTLQFTHTVTKGIVSALNRTLEVEGANGVTYLQNLVQHDASINPGNSGGPLISLDGKIIGINTLKATEAEGIGFAIPIDVAKAIVGQIVENNSYVAPYLGIFGFDATIAQYYGYTLEGNGVYVVNIDNNGPAKISGIEVGDVIVGINDKEINTMLDLRIGLYKYKTGDAVKITVINDEMLKEVTLTLSERP